MCPLWHSPGAMTHRQIRTVIYVYHSARCTADFLSLPPCLSCVHQTHFQLSFPTVSTFLSPLTFTISLNVKVFESYSVLLYLSSVRLTHFSGPCMKWSHDSTVRVMTKIVFQGLETKDANSLDWSTLNMAGDRRLRLGNVKRTGASGVEHKDQRKGTIE